MNKPQNKRDTAEGAEATAGSVYKLNNNKTNIVKWKRLSVEAISVKHGISVHELRTGIMLTDAEYMAKLEADHPYIEIQDPEEYPDLTPEQLLEIEAVRAGTAGSAETKRKAAEEAEKRYQRRYKHEVNKQNKLIEARNAVTLDVIKEGMKRYREIGTVGRRAAAVDLKDNYMSRAARDMVTSDPMYRDASDQQFSTPFEMFAIVDRMFSDSVQDASIRAENARDKLKRVTMTKADGFYSYCTEFRDAYTTVILEGGVIDAALRIQWFLNGLHSTVFGQVKADFDYDAHRRMYPVDFDEFVKEMESRYSKYKASKASTSGDSAVVFKTDTYKDGALQIATVAPTSNSQSRKRRGEANDDRSTKKRKERGSDSESVSSRSGREKCHICHRRHIGVCLNLEKLEAHVAEIKKSGKPTFSYKPRTERATVKTVAEESDGDSESEASVKNFRALDGDVLPQLFEAEFETICTNRVSKTIRVIHDNAADRSLVSCVDLGFNPRRTNVILSGVVQGASVHVDTVVDLPLEFGTALVSGDTNILADCDIKKSYSRDFIGTDRLQLTSTSGNIVLNFYYDPDKYGNKKYNGDIPEEIWYSARSTSSVLSFYQPHRPSLADLTQAQMRSIDEARYAHCLFNHPEDQVLGGIIDSEPNIKATREGLALWRSTHGPCEGCLQGKMTAHAQLPSTKKIKYVAGEAAGCDIGFFDGEPVLLAVDIGSQYLMERKLEGRTIGDLKGGIGAIQSQFAKAGHVLKYLLTDRERAVAMAKQQIEEAFHLTITLSAAGQHQPHIESQIGHLKNVMRATLAGITEREGYQFSWIDLLRADCIKCICHCPKRGELLSPYFKFTGKPFDFIRGMRALLGAVVIVFCPKRGVATDMRLKGEWAIVRERSMDGTGVIGVLILSTRRTAHRLKFSFCKPTERVKAMLATISKLPGPFLRESDPVTLEELTDPHAEYEELTAGYAGEAAELTEQNLIEPIAAQIQGAPEGEGVADEQVAEPNMGTGPEPGEEKDAEPAAADPTTTSRRYSLRARTGPARDPEYVYTVQQSLYSGMREDGELLEDRESLLTIMAGQVMYKHALKSEHGAAAKESMTKEIALAVKMAVFHGVHFKDLTAEERRLILKSTSLYKEKYFPSGDFEKAKSRVLVRGDMQKPEYTAESSSPVARRETVFVFLAVCVFLSRIFFKVDFIGAYLNTVRPPEVKHKHVYLPPEIAAVLIEVEPSFAEFLQPDGRILVEMDKLMYGYKEAGYYWYKLLTDMFFRNGYTASFWDPCLLFKHDAKGSRAVCVTVDDCLFAVTSAALQDEVIVMCNDAFGNFTVDTGKHLNHLGMTLDFSQPGAVSVAQAKCVADLCGQFPGLKVRKTPCAPSFLNDPPADDPPCDRERFRSLVMLCFYLARGGTYPELLYPVSMLARRVNDASDFHWKLLMRMIGYLSSDPDHCVYIEPGSLNIVGSADASHADHIDCKSHSGGSVGFRGAGDVPDCYVNHFSSKQSIVAKSTMESEIVSQDSNADNVIWTAGIRDDILSPDDVSKYRISGAHMMYRDNGESRELYDAHKTALLQGDNLSAKITLEKGRGSHKKAKHILKRFFYIYDLILAGRVLLMWVPSADLVADILTKPVEIAIFFHLLPMLIGRRRRM